MNKEVKGYVLSLTKYKESDYIVNFLTKDGLIGFKVRAGQKITSKFVNKVQQYQYGEYILCYLKDDDKSFLKEVIKLDYINDISTDIKKNIILSFLAESIIKDNNIVNPYQIYDLVFNMVKNNDYNFENIIALILKIHLLSNGSFLEGDCCAKCGSKSNIVNVSFKDGGFLCSSCNNSNNQKSLAYLKAYRYIAKANIIDCNKFNIDKEIMIEILNDLFSFLEENTGIKLLTKKMILNII